METRALTRLKRKTRVEILWLYISSILSEGNSYAYDISRKINERYGFNPGRVLPYVVLGKMESEGLVRSYYAERRKYYALTDKGRQTYCLALEMLRELLQKLPETPCRESASDPKPA
ncbi:PadR family transcriptional regulator [Infirmifilum sp. SLHALR2]|nr:MAG: hypothetical protein B7L53_08725 [Thermofilum sp. NZ13]